jgi:hypothetical protein
MTGVISLTGHQFKQIARQQPAPTIDDLPGMRPAFDRKCLNCDQYLAPEERGHEDHNTVVLNALEAESATMENMIRYGA